MPLHHAKPIILLALLIGSLMLPATASTLAQAQAGDDLSKKHGKIFTSLENLTVQFSQTSYRKLRNKTTSRKGMAAFAKPGKFYWAFQDLKSGNEEYFYDGTKLSFFKHRENTVTHYGKKSGLASELDDVVSLVLDTRNLLSTYEPRNVASEKGITTFDLVPKKGKKTDIKGIAVQVSESQKYIRHVKIEYDNGNFTLFEFSNPKKDAIPAQRFIFSNPGSVKENHVG